MSQPPLGFIPEPITLALDRILPSRKPPEGLHASRKFKQIVVSMEAVGMIEPLSVGKVDKKTGQHILLAAGIGVTPFVSQLRHLRLERQGGGARDVVFVYVASGAEELAFRQDLEDAGIPVIVFTRDEPTDLPPHWTWAQGVRLDAAGLEQVVPDLASRHAYISGPPGLIADLAPALEKAHGLTTDAFSGY